MRASIAIAAHNEGELLSKTVKSCLETTEGLDCEIVVADDGSTDGSVSTMEREFPSVRVVRGPGRCGTSAAKDLSVRESRGDVVIVLDGHCKPEPGAIERLVEDVELSDGEAIVSPSIQVLDAKAWRNEVGPPLGYWLDLEWFNSGWLATEELAQVRWPGGRTLLRTPAFIGCSLAISRRLYDSLGGFDVGLLSWGSDDTDLSLRAWLLGHSIALDPEAIIGHRFRAEGEASYPVPTEHCIYNMIRMARRNLGEAAWTDWRARMAETTSPADWAPAWALYLENREALERENAALRARRVRDEYWYANEFGLAWPLTLPGSPIEPPAAPARPRFDRASIITASKSSVTPIPPRRSADGGYLDPISVGLRVEAALVV